MLYEVITLFRLAGNDPREREVQVELGNPLFVDGGRPDLDQDRLRNPWRSLDIAHERGHARIGLRVAEEADVHAPLLDRLQVA